MKIGVIVPAYEAEPTIGACLDGLLAAGFSVGDITVVDDGSRDRTAQIVRGRGIQPICQPNQGAARARNAGAEASQGEILFFVDSDVVVHADVRTRLERFFSDHPDHAGLFGSYDDAPPAPPRVSRLRNLLHHHVHQRAAGAASTFWTGCGALRRHDFDRAGGFRTEEQMIEDVGLGLRLARLGRPVMLVPDLLCTHLKSWGWRDFAKTDYRHRAQPWTRMMRDPANGDLAHALNAGARGKAAVIAVGFSLLSLPLAVVAPWAGIALGLLALAALVGLEWRFLELVRHRLGQADAALAVAMLWVHYLAAGAGYARVRLFG
ncbi:glycosyltransferase family 2 protein [Paracoccus aestuarii]|uniref:glycosyltransferase family 2 protein n=1 Tax=Paracoccus aestuarii TaxID=453842 RepID=UPI0014737311|nr:glycosyltransferase [Paracoccus aestuarii]